MELFYPQCPLSLHPCQNLYEGLMDISFSQAKLADSSLLTRAIIQNPRDFFTGFMGSPGFFICGDIVYSSDGIFLCSPDFSVLSVRSQARQAVEAHRNSLEYFLETKDYGEIKAIALKDETDLPVRQRRVYYLSQQIGNFEIPLKLGSDQDPLLNWIFNGRAEDVSGGLISFGMEQLLFRFLDKDYITRQGRPFARNLCIGFPIEDAHLPQQQRMAILCNQRIHKRLCLGVYDPYASISDRSEEDD
ncbi:MAG: hypothetical protein PHF67_03445 [Candidatus Nanoarchaeia archaeon]|nr:hypothetical protein [Candidatus Nanoarchaeia archaeon]